MIGGPVALKGGSNHMRQCRHGLMICNRNDQYIGCSPDLHGEYNQYERAVLRSVLRSSDTVVEVGANIGPDGATNVRTRRMAVGSEADSIEVPVLDPNRSNNSGPCTRLLGARRDVPLVTLDSLDLQSAQGRR